jgi:hypothetical protein
LEGHGDDQLFVAKRSTEIRKKTFDDF